MALSKVAILGVVFSLLALVSLAYLPFGIPVPVPAQISDALPMTTLAFYVLLVISAVMPVLLLCGGMKSKSTFILMFIALSVIAIFLAIEVLVYSGIVVHMAVPYLWNGIPGVMEKGFKEQCSVIPHKELMGKVVFEGCPHQCLYSIGQMAGLCVDAALQIAMGGIPVVTIPTPTTHGLTAPPGDCVSNAEFDQVESMVKNEGPIFSLLFICMISAIVLNIFALTCGLVTFCMVKTSNAREATKVEPLLSAEEQTA
jgi:hypothetical protein